MLAKRKLISIEKLVSQALIDFEISQGEYKSIINEDKNYRRLEEDNRMMKSDGEVIKKIQNRTLICRNPEHVHKDQTEVENNINIMISKSKK